MFTPEYFINSVQSGKKYVINTFVTDENIKKSLIEVVDAQTEFAKTAAKNVIGLTELFVKNFTTATKQ